MIGFESQYRVPEADLGALCLWKEGYRSAPGLRFSNKKNIEIKYANLAEGACF